MSDLTVLAFIVGFIVIGRLAVWAIGRLLDRPVKNQPSRTAVPDDGIDLTGANDFFEPRCVASTAMAAARIPDCGNKEAAAVERPAS